MFETPTQTKNLKASKQPLDAISMVAYNGQPEHMRKYVTGYENYMNNLPELQEDELLEFNVEYTDTVMNQLGKAIVFNGRVDKLPQDNQFEREIVAIQDPETISFQGRDVVVKAGVELVVAKWGTGFTSPVHGHSAGYIYENILKGKMRVNNYRLYDQYKGVVRLTSTTIQEAGVFVHQYNFKAKDEYFKRQYLIHNFTALEPSASLHYLPEHTRDGRDNGFKVEYFEDTFNFLNEDLMRITSKEAMYSRVGDVILVRSSNVPEYGDHYMIVTGKPVMKEHGLRPQDVAIAAPHTTRILDSYDLNETGVILLKLSQDAKEEFLKFHAISVVNNEVVMP